MPRANESEFIAHVLRGHHPAIAFAQKIFRVSQLVDDLFDGDEVSQADKEWLFGFLLFEMHTDPFFHRHSVVLREALKTAYTCWLDANALEKGDQHQRSIAFGLRSMTSEVLLTCADVVGGYAWRREVSVAVREHIFEETLDEFHHEHTNER